MEARYAYKNILCSVHEIYFSESKEIVRILSVLHTYLALTSGDKTNENSDLLIIYILVENLYMLLRYL